MEKIKVESKSSEEALGRIYLNLQKLVGLHRKLLDAVRIEREALVDADLSAIHSITSTKQNLVECIHAAENERLKLTGELALLWRRNLRDLTLPKMIIEVQGWNVKLADQFRSALNTLTVLIQRITDQNEDNRGLVEKSLEHIHQMKKNILGDPSLRSDTYNQQGKKISSSPSSRLVSKEV